MNIELKVALITSLTSLLIALVSLISIFINHRLLKKEKKQSSIEKNIEKNIESINKINIAIQVFKDTITYINCGVYAEKEIAIKKIINESDHIVQVYENVFVDFEKDEKIVAHHLKNIIIEFRNIIINHIYELDSIKDLSPETKDRFNRLRNNLSETQDMLTKQKKNKLRLYE